MATKVLEQQVINELERPKSSDINQAQSLLQNTMQLLAWSTYSNGSIWSGVPYSGFDGPLSMRVTVPTSGAANRIILQPGVMFAAADDAQTDIGDIAGVSALSPQRLAVCTEPRTITVPQYSLPSDSCRRDVLCIKATSYLKDYTPTDIFNPTLQSFGPPVSKPKALGVDLATSAIQFVYWNYTPALVTAPLVYILGAEVAYSGPDSWLAAPIPNIPDGYHAVSVVNIGGTGGLGIQQNNIADHRRILTPGGTRSRLFIDATLGSSSLPDTMAQVFSYEAKNQGNEPRFIVRSRYDDPLTAPNQLFDVCIFTGQRASAVISVSGQQVGNLRTNGDGLPLTDPGTSPVMILETSALTQQTVDDAFRNELLNPRVCPDGLAVVDNWLAIGQPYMRVQFALAKPLAQPDGNIKLATGAAEFGVDSLGYPLKAPTVRLVVDWYPY